MGHGWEAKIGRDVRVGSRFSRSWRVQPGFMSGGQRFCCPRSSFLGMMPCVAKLTLREQPIADLPNITTLPKSPAAMHKGATP
jgi:hypothetical protein